MWITSLLNINLLFCCNLLGEKLQLDLKPKQCHNYSYCKDHSVCTNIKKKQTNILSIGVSNVCFQECPKILTLSAGPGGGGGGGGRKVPALFSTYENFFK